MELESVQALLAKMCSCLSILRKPKGPELPKLWTFGALSVLRGTDLIYTVEFYRLALSPDVPTEFGCSPSTHKDAQDLGIFFP